MQPEHLPVCPGHPAQSGGQTQSALLYQTLPCACHVLKACCPYQTLKLLDVKGAAHASTRTSGWGQALSSPCAMCQFPRSELHPSIAPFEYCELPLQPAKTAKASLTDPAILGSVADRRQEEASAKSGPHRHQITEVRCTITPLISSLTFPAHPAERASFDMCVLLMQALMCLAQPRR